MSSFLKPLKGSSRSKGGFQIKPKGAASSDRIKEVLNRNRIESQRAMSMGPTPASNLNPSSTAIPGTKDRPSCPNPSCPNPSAPVTDGFCSACGREVDSSNIVAEIQFGETSSGAAVVHGSFVGADQGAATRNLAPQYRRLGGGLTDAREKTIREAKNMMVGFAHQLREIPPGAVDAGIQIFKLVMEENWLQGRGMDKVVPVCLYTACRREDKCKVMLIDFAELVKVNVYELGHVFKDLNNIYSFQNNNVKSIIPEDLMYRFASKLDFGDFTNKVAADATRLCQRMGRDWMIMGRRPSGICGACILMAARMWNFRRTVREVVYVVKVTTHTIEQRLGEFTVTESSELSIEDFLNQEFLESRHDPPSFYKNTAEWKEKMEKERGARKRKRVIEDIDGDDEIGSNIGTPEPSSSYTMPRCSSTTTNMPPPPVPRPPPDTSNLRQVSEYLPRSFDSAEGREFVMPFDPENVPEPAPRKMGDNALADGLNAKDPTGDDAIDELAAAYGSPEDRPDNDQNQEGEEGSVAEAGTRRRGKKGSVEPFLTFNEEWERDEAVLEQQIEEVINDPHSDSHRKALATAAHIAHIKAEWARSLLPQRELKMDEIIGEDEFADDPEVQHCKLSEKEVEIKESIWINANKDWLRKQQEKTYRKQMEELGPPKRRRNRVKKPRIGEGQLTPASTPGEAAVEALKKRSTYSKRINYDAISNLFSSSNKNRGPGSVVSRNDSEVASRLTSRAGSVSDAGTPQPANDNKTMPSVAAAKAVGNEQEAEDYNEQEEAVQEVYDYDDDQEQPVYDEDGYGEDDYEEEEYY
ncbi:transcription factor TFIIIB subunit brf1 [Parahypoxylon ruwenzoriense]